MGSAGRLHVCARSLDCATFNLSTIAPKLMPELIIIDKQNPECCALSWEQHCAESLGAPLKLPPSLADRLSERWAMESEEDLLALFALITGQTYQQVWRENTYNQENDLDSFAVVTVYADTECSDWCWRRDCFVVVETGAGGDPRYCSYSAAQVYRLEDSCIGDSCFLDWRLGYWLTPVSDQYDGAELDTLNDRCSATYSSWPWGELNEGLESAPVWSDKRGAFICRPKGISFPCIMQPVAPFYGG